MLILACDTSGPSASTALWLDSRLLAEMTLQGGPPHAVTMLPLVEEILRQTGKSIQDVDAFACAVGPGSFTGIRIGVSAVKAMAYATSRPAIGISTLKALAWPYACCAGALVCSVLSARNNRIFAAAWQDGQPLLAEANWLDTDFLDALEQQLGLYPAASQPALLLAGDVPTAFLQIDGSSRLAAIQKTPRSSALPRAAVIAELAELELLAGAVGSPQQLKPQYLSLSQAERRKAASHD